MDAYEDVTISAFGVNLADSSVRNVSKYIELCNTLSSVQLIG